jgi:hypothetical protein
MAKQTQTKRGKTQSAAETKLPTAEQQVADLQIRLAQNTRKEKPNMAEGKQGITPQEAQAVLEAQWEQLLAQVRAEIAAVCEKYQVMLMPVVTFYGQQVINEVRIAPRKTEGG